MKLIALALVSFAVAAPSKTVRLAIVHSVHGCHVWQSNHDLGPASTVRLKRGDRIELRVNCPMDFTLRQVRGPKLALGDPTMHTGTSRVIFFPKKGVYAISAVNV